VLLHQVNNQSAQAEIVNLFASIFAFSEGVREGGLIGGLAAQLAAKIDHRCII
jgi:hypothetical protein